MSDSIAMFESLTKPLFLLIIRVYAQNLNTHLYNKKFSVYSQLSFQFKRFVL